jgi:hypothetical protein
LIAGLATRRAAVPIVDIQLAATAVGVVAAAAAVIIAHAARTQISGKLSERSAATTAAATGAE